MSDEIKKYNIAVEDISRAFAGGYHFVGNGYEGHYDGRIDKHPISFSECVDMCTKKQHADGKAWNSFRWTGDGNYCWYFKGGGDLTPNSQHVHFRI